MLYFGAQDGSLFALDAKTGHVRWHQHVDGAIKGAPTVAAGRLVVGAYDGHVYAFNTSSGRVIWRTDGPALGQFYSSPSIVGGRIFIGSTDGNIYAFALSGGRRLWAHSTSGYVYASPVIDHGTLYAGSYDGNLYALDADTGRARWTYAVGGKISRLGRGRRRHRLRRDTGRRQLRHRHARRHPALALAGRLLLSGRSLERRLLPRRSLDPRPPARGAHLTTQRSVPRGAARCTPSSFAVCIYT